MRFFLLLILIAAFAQESAKVQPKRLADGHTHFGGVDQAGSFADQNEHVVERFTMIAPDSAGAKP
jgi:hypothetical protein